MMTPRSAKSYHEGTGVGVQRIRAARRVSDEVLSEVGNVSGEGHRFPPSGVLAETEAVLAATERRKTGDRFVFVGAGRRPS